MKTFFVVMLSVVACAVSALSSKQAATADDLIEFKKCVANIALMFPEKPETPHGINGMFRISLENLVNNSSYHQSLVKEVDEKRMKEACAYSDAMQVCLSKVAVDDKNDPLDRLRTTVNQIREMVCETNVAKSITCLVNVETHESEPCNIECHRYADNLRSLMNHNGMNQMYEKQVWISACNLMYCRTGCLKPTIVERCGDIMDIVKKSYRLALRFSSLDTNYPIESIDECSKEKLFAYI